MGFGDVTQGSEVGSLTSSSDKVAHCSGDGSLHAGSVNVEPHSGYGFPYFGSADEFLNSRSEDAAPGSTLGLKVRGCMNGDISPGSCLEDKGPDSGTGDLALGSLLGDVVLSFSSRDLNLRPGSGYADLGSGSADRTLTSATGEVFLQPSSGSGTSALFSNCEVLALNSAFRDTKL